MIKKLIAVSASLFLANCGAVPNADDAANADGSKTEEQKKKEEIAKSFSASSMSDLNLSQVLSLQLPDSIKANGQEASLRLAARGKSFEACKLRSEIREGLSNISQAAATFCHLEKAKVAFGKKYNIKFEMPSGGSGGAGGPGGPGGPGGTGGGTPPTMDPNNPPPGFPTLALAGSGMPSSIQVWIDDSKKETGGKIRLYMCEDEKLRQMIELTGAGTGKSKGSMLMKGEISMGGMFDMAFHRAAKFDSGFTKEGHTTISVKERVTFKSSQHGDEVARRLLALDLPTDGVAKVVSSFAGNQMGSEVAFASVGLFDSKFGTAIARGKAPQAIPGSETAGDFSNQSYFDGKSYVVDPAAYADIFGENGKLALTSSSLPNYLPMDFKPEDLPADAWDCTGADEELKIDPTDGDHASCEEDWNQLSEESCFEAGFQAGEAVTIKDGELANAEEFEGFQPPVPAEPVGAEPAKPE